MDTGTATDTRAQHVKKRQAHRGQEAEEKQLHIGPAGLHIHFKRTGKHQGMQFSLQHLLLCIDLTRGAVSETDGGERENDTSAFQFLVCTFISI